MSGSKNKFPLFFSEGKDTVAKSCSLPRCHVPDHGHFSLKNVQQRGHRPTTNPQEATVAAADHQGQRAAPAPRRRASPPPAPSAVSLGNYYLSVTRLSSESSPRNFPLPYQFFAATYSYQHLKHNFEGDKTILVLKE